MRCKRCNNEDPKYFYKGSKGYYCRKCIKFKRILIEEEIQSSNYQVDERAYEYELSFNLSIFQKEASRKCLEALKDNRDVFLKCVCGSGKTELSLESISYYLEKGLRVGYAISRREVVLELQDRFLKYFKNAKVVKVCGGFTKEIEGDLIVCTTHQLYRYYKTFDLLILDEVDAFPFKGDEVLFNIALNSCKGRVILSSATIDDEMNKRIKLFKNLEIVELNLRPHLKKIPEPKLILVPPLIDLLLLFYLIKNRKRRTIVFAPLIKDVKKLNGIFKHFFKCDYISSKTEDKSKIIKAFRDEELDVLFATTILERGVTFINIDVIIFKGSHSVFDRPSIIQMAGRAGRNYNYPEGNVYIITNSINYEIRSSISEIKESNIKGKEIKELYGR